MKEETFIETPNRTFIRFMCPKSATDNDWRKCNHCGRFISYKQMEEQKDVIFHFIPDTEFTIEETYWIHKKCL
jgi:acetyl-CoA carboxylase beta subunit